MEGTRKYIYIPREGWKMTLLELGGYNQGCVEQPWRRALNSELKCHSLNNNKGHRNEPRVN